MLGSVPRLFFANNQSLNQDMRPFVFNSTDEEECVDIPVFVKVSIVMRSRNCCDVVVPFSL